MSKAMARISDCFDQIQNTTEGEIDPDLVEEMHTQIEAVQVAIEWAAGYVQSIADDETENPTVDAMNALGYLNKIHTEF